MNKSIFRDHSLQTHFQEDGYIKISLFNRDEIYELRKIFEKWFDKENFEAFRSTNFSRNKIETLEISNEITKLVYPKFNEVFLNVDYWMAAFLVKPSNFNIEFEVHQDFTFVDEEQFYSGNIWIPLQDTDENNGSMYFIEKTHYKYLKTIRSLSNVEFFKGFESLVKPFSHSVNCKLGEVVIFQHSIIHGSNTNLSSQDRLAISCGFNSSDTSLIHYVRINDEELSLVEMEENFVFKMDDFSSLQNPDLMLSKTAVKPSTKKYNREQVVTIIQNRLSGKYMNDYL